MVLRRRCRTSVIHERGGQFTPSERCVGFGYSLDRRIKGFRINGLWTYSSDALGLLDLERVQIERKFMKTGTYAWSVGLAYSPNVLPASLLPESNLDH